MGVARRGSSRRCHDQRRILLERPGPTGGDARHLTALGPAIFVGLGAAVMLAYPLTEERFRAIVTDLAARSVDREGRPTG